MTKRAAPTSKQLEREQRSNARAALRLARMNLTTARVDARDVFRALPAQRKAAIQAIRAKAQRRRDQLRGLYKVRLIELRNAVQVEIEAVRMHVRDAKAKARAEVEIRRSAVRRAQALVDQYLTAAQRSARTTARANLTNMAEAFDVGANAIAHELPGAVPAFRKYARTAQARRDYKAALAALKRAHPRGDYHPSDAGERLAVAWLESMQQQGASGESYAHEEAAALAEMSFARAEEAAARCSEEAERRWAAARTPAEQREVEELFAACQERAWRASK